MDVFSVFDAAHRDERRSRQGIVLIGREASGRRRGQNEDHPARHRPSECPGGAPRRRDDAARHDRRGRRHPDRLDLSERIGSAAFGGSRRRHTTTGYERANPRSCSVPSRTKALDSGSIDALLGGPRMLHSLLDGDGTLLGLLG